MPRGMPTAQPIIVGRFDFLVGAGLLVLRAVGLVVMKTVCTPDAPEVTEVMTEPAADACDPVAEADAAVPELPPDAADVAGADDADCATTDCTVEGFEDAAAVEEAAGAEDAGAADVWGWLEAALD